MNSQDVQKVIESYWRVRDKGLAEGFYEIFLEADPRIRPMFKHTDFSRQKELLLQSIFVLLEYAGGSAVGKMAVKRLGKKHDRKHLAISTDMYSVWIDSLIRALRDLDKEFSPILEKHWREAVQKGIDIMIGMA